MKLPRVYPILDTQLLSAKDCSAEAAASAWLDAGAQILQFRHKGQWTRDIFAEAGRIATMCRDRNAIFVVNDRADMARLLEAGLHLGQDDLPPRDARRLLGEHPLLGFSTHNPHQLINAETEPADYLAIGPIYATTSKQNPDPVVGLYGLCQCRPICTGPLVAIGGITRQTAADVFAAGADAVAVISDLIPEPCTGDNLRRRMEEWLQLAQN